MLSNISAQKRVMILWKSKYFFLLTSHQLTAVSFFFQYKYQKSLPHFFSPSSPKWYNCPVLFLVAAEPNMWDGCVLKHHQFHANSIVSHFWTLNCSHETSTLLRLSLIKVSVCSIFCKGMRTYHARAINCTLHLIWDCLTSWIPENKKRYSNNWSHDSLHFN